MGGYKRWLLWLLIFVVIPLAVYGIYVQIRTARQIVPRIREELVKPYAEAVRRGDFEGAYLLYTAKEFQKAYPLEAYLKAQKKNSDEFGGLASLTLKGNDPFQSAGNLFSGRRYHEGGLVYRGTKAETWVWWEVVQEDGVFKVEAMFEMFHERLTARIF